jgi:hypothetical protein
MVFGGKCSPLAFSYPSGFLMRSMVMALSLLIAYLPPLIGQAQWRISARPTLVLGGADTLPVFEFRDVRGAFTTENGLLVVADGASRQLRVFGSSEVFIREFGKRGEGPAEFGAISWADNCGGTITVYDYARGRITRWTSDGMLLDGFKAESTDPGQPPFSVSCGTSGEYAVVGWPDVTLRAVTGGPYRPDVKVGLLGTDGRLRRIIGIFPGSERYRYSQSDGPRPFGKSTTARLGSNGVYVGTGDDYEIQVFQDDGIRKVVEKVQPPTRIDRAIVKHWEDSIIARMPASARPAIRQSLSVYVHPEYLPAYSTFRLDNAGLLWVSNYPRQGAATVRWDVFGPHGVQVAWVELSSRLRPTEIGRDYIIGVMTDGLGVERVVKHALLR